MTSLPLLARACVVRREGETVYLSSPAALPPIVPRLGDWLRRAAERVSDRTFLMERDGDALRRVTYAEALRAAEGIASWLTDGFPADARVLSVSANSVDHALVMLGCFLAGVAFVPVSPAYSLMSEDFAKLRHVVEKIRPAVVFADHDRVRGLDVAVGSGMGSGMAAGKTAGAKLLVKRSPLGSHVDSVASIARRASGPAALRREAAIDPDRVAKILFTSGSTGFPKGVPNTHRMLASNQAMIAAAWPFLAEGEPPIVVDWLPWSHTFGGNHDFNMVLAHAGTLLVDEGKPTPQGMPASLRNLREVPPTLYFNVPAGYAALVTQLEADAALRQVFFSRLKVAFYAAAALPPDLWARLHALAAAERRDVFFTTAWGSTETSPLATTAHFELPASGNIGLPAPGVTLKIVPSGSKREIRVKGPSVMEGYLDEPALTRAAFDEEGFYRIGDAVRFADESDPSQGLLFDGRVAEDFKLSSGTWVSVTTIRTGILAEAGGLLADVVVAGHDREELAVLAWPSIAGCRALVGRDASTADLAAEPSVRDGLARAVASWNARHGASSTRVARAMLLAEPPNLDAGEITDKGYTNQRAVLERRSAMVTRLFAEPAAADVIVAQGVTQGVAQR